MTLPNLVTLSRLLALPVLLFYLQNPEPEKRWFCLAIFLLAALTDWLDGYLARKLNSITELGKFLDPLVDKLLILAPMLTLIEEGMLPAWGVFLILARELTVAGWRVTPSLTGSTAIVGANVWGKLKTVSQISAIALLIAPKPTTWHIPSLIAFWISVALTLISGAIYLLPPKREQGGRGAEGQRSHASAGVSPLSPNPTPVASTGETPARRRLHFVGTPSSPEGTPSPPPPQSGVGRGAEEKI